MNEQIWPNAEASAALSVPRSWPLVGRMAELSYITHVITRGSPAGLVLAGDAGVGKTRLASEAVAEAERGGCATEWVVATRSSASIPFGAFAHLLPEAAGSSSNRLDLLQRVGRSLSERARGRRLVIGVDDAHLLDDASAALVHQLAAAARAFVLLSLRAGEDVPDSVLALWKDGLTERLDLQALSEDQVGDLLARVLGAHVDGPTRLRLWEATRGNVLFLRELVLAGLESQTLADAGGIWAWRGPLTVSPRLHEVIDARIGKLDSDQSALMEVLSLVEPVPAPFLESLFASETLEEAERMGMAVVEQAGRRVLFRLAHPLYGQAVRTRCPSLRARTIYRQFAQAIEATGTRRREDLMRLLVARLEAGQGGPAHLFIAGARRALSSFDPILAERLARAALNAGGGAPARHVLAAALLNQSRAHADDFLVQPEERGDDEQERAASALLQAMGLLSVAGGRPDEAEHLLLAAEESIEDPDLRDQLRTARGEILFFSGQPGKAFAALSDVLQRQGASERACVGAVLFAIPCLAVAGRPDQAVSLAEQWLEAAYRATNEHPLAPRMILAGKAYALRLAGRLREAGDLAASGYQLSLGDHAYGATAMSAMFVGSVALAGGHVRAAGRWLREAAGLLRAESGSAFLPICLAELTQAAALAGDLAIATQALADAQASHTAWMAFAEPGLELARAWLAAAEGEISKARQLALDAADGATEHGEHALAVHALHDVARLGDARSVVARLRHLASTVEGPLAPACAAHAEALAVHDGPGLDRASESFEAIGAMLLAAEAAAQAAATYRAEGKKGSMLASSARARRLLESCGGARTPALSGLAPDPLTPREREVAMLAAGGLTSPEIAERLVLSVRTVEGYLQRAYAKLGITSRAELRSVLAVPAAGHDPPRSGT
jgi:DNA-binding CsgD family transcriptional regulator